MKKKTRGLRRKCRVLVATLIKLTEEFPEGSSDKEFWHFHIPVKKSFADSKRTPKKARKLLIQTLINRSEYLSTLKPSGNVFCKVVCIICKQELSRSQIIIFFNKEYFNSFFIRNDEEQVWILIETNEFDIKSMYNIPLRFSIKYYLENIYDGDVVWKDELLVIGELE